MKEINKRLVEVEYILRKLDDEYINKIPQEVWDYINKNKDKNYVFEYDNDKILSEQNLNIDTISILTYINMEYLLEEKERRELLELLKKDDMVAEQQKKEKYNPEDLFKNKKEEPKEPISLIEVKIEKWYEKLFSFFRKILRK